jgi:hypothetical protein
MFSRSGKVVLTALCVALTAAACDKAQLLAPTNSTVSVTAPTRVLPVGGSTEIQAFVAESSGTPVQNGTTVRFSTNLGVVNPVEAQTRNGMATTTFTGTASGTAEIRATSGTAGAGTTPTTPPNGTPTPTGSSVVTIAVGTAAVATTGGVTVRASPGNVPSTGGTVELIASVVGEGGRPLPGVPVTFAATRGTLGASSAISDENGEARTTLTTGEASEVRARAGAVESAAVTVAVRTGPSVTLTCAVGATTNCANVTVGQLVTFTATRGATTSPITSARLEFGDGESVSLGSLSSPVTVSHAYTSPGTYTARLVVTDNGGETASEVQVVQVRGIAGATVTADAETTRRVRATAELNGASTSDAVSYEWTFDGTTPNMVTTTNQATFTYSTGGAKTITVRITFRDGRTATASTTITLPA